MHMQTWHVYIIFIIAHIYYIYILFKHRITTIILLYWHFIIMARFTKKALRSADAAYWERSMEFDTKSLTTIIILIIVNGKCFCTWHSFNKTHRMSLTSSCHGFYWKSLIILIEFVGTKRIHHGIFICHINESRNIWNYVWVYVYGTFRSSIEACADFFVQMRSPQFARIIIVTVL